VISVFPEITLEGTTLTTWMLCQFDGGFSNNNLLLMMVDGRLLVLMPPTLIAPKGWGYLIVLL
jgi:hypothetical protein